MINITQGHLSDWGGGTTNMYHILSLPVKLFADMGLDKVYDDNKHP